MANFVCDGCQEQIPPQKARIRCQNCLGYDSCTNCYVIGQVSGSHTSQHQATIYRLSGQRPPGVATPGSRSEAPSITPTQNTAPAGWDRLFNLDQSPTLLLSSVIQEFFRRLDPSETGYLIPEAYASFIDAQEQPIENNIWKDAYSKAFGDKLSSADQALQQVFDIFSVEYILRERPGVQQPQVQNGRFSHGLFASLNPPPTQMPMLTLRGFTTAVTKDTYTNPDGWIYLNRALRYYQLPIWHEKGDIPKSLVPDVSPAGIQAMKRAAGHLDMMQMQTGARVANELLTGVQTYRMY